MTVEELKAFIKESMSKAAENLTEENRKFIEEMEKTLASLAKPADDAKKIGNDEEDPTAGFPFFAEFAQSVYRAGKAPREKWDKRLLAMVEKAAGDGLSEGVDAEGGFLVPREYATKLLNLATTKSLLMNRCTRVPMTTNAISIPYIKDVDRSGGYIYGAIKIYFVDEESAATASKPKFGRINLNLHDMIGLVYATNQLLEDSPVSIEPLLTTLFTSAFAWTIDGLLLNGTGAGQPLGIKNAPCLIEVAKESGQAADTIDYKNILNMESRLPAESDSTAIYVANRDTIPQLGQMNLAVGTGGSAVWLPQGSVGAQAAGKFQKTLLGRPLVFSEHCQKLGDAGDIYLADFSQYLLAEKKGQGLMTATSIHLKFDYNQSAFRFIFRVDGQPWLVSAITPRYSSSTLSPFITIAERA